MLVSMRLLKEIIPFDYTAEELSVEFSLLGLEVEGIEKYHHKFSNIVTAKVKDIERITGTKLFSLKAVTDKDVFQVVTAATNLSDGDIVPLALPNSILADGTKITSKTFKGHISNGMLCSYAELGLDGEILASYEKEGIFILPKDTPVGIPMEDVFPIDDEYINLSLLPDRADAFYVLGVARWIEILKARSENRKADFSGFEISTNIKTEGKTTIPVVIEAPDLAPFYSGRTISGVKVGRSSLSLRQKLYMLRSRPINNIVDITNFILKFYGQPLHSFDADKLKEKIVVRKAREGEKIKTLDGVERKLNEWNLVIADSERPVAIAGVMGGEDTEVTFDTKNVFLESAYFSPPCISRSSRSLNLMTDASMLFEKGTDPEFPEKASLIASELILKEAGGNVKESNTASYLGKLKPVNVRIKRIGLLLGEDVSKEEVKKYLEFEGLKCVDKGEYFEVHYPSFRRDLNIEVDVIEEVLRMKGYNSFDEKPIFAPLKSARRTEEEQFLWDLKEKLVREGLMEIQTVSLIGANLLEKALMDKDSVAKVVNPFSEEMVILRPSLFPLMLNVVEVNNKNGVSDLAIFEVGKIFSANGNGNYTENYNVGIMLSGERIFTNPFKKHLNYDFYYLKGIIEDLLEEYGIDFDVKEEKFPFLHLYQSAAFYANNKRIGFIGAVNSDVLKNFDVKKSVFYGELDFESLLRLRRPKEGFKEYPQYPPLKMDVAIVVKDAVPEKEVRNAILSIAPEELKDIVLFDIYRGKPLKEDEKNLAYSLSFYSPERTLKREEIEEFIEKLDETVRKVVGGKLRKG